MAIDPDLFASVVEALDAAYDEFVALRDGWPEVPDDLQRILDEHAAMKATLAAVRAGFAAKGLRGWHDRVLAIYREQMATTAGTAYQMPSSPVLPEVVATIEAVREDVRRRALVDGDVRDALQARMAV